MRKGLRARLKTTQKQIKRSSLRTRLQWSVSLFALGGTVVLSLMVFLFVARLERMAWQSRQLETAGSIAGTVEALMSRTQGLMDFLGELDPVYLNENASLIVDFLKQNGALLEVLRLNSAGRVISGATQLDQPILTNTFTIPQSSWFLEARQGKSYTGDLQLSAANQPYIILAEPTGDGGVVVALLSMDLLWSRMSSDYPGQTGQAYMVDAGGTLIAYPDPAVIAQRVSILEQPEMAAALHRADEPWAGRYRNFQGVDVLGVAVRLQVRDWYVFAETPMVEASTSTVQASLWLTGMLAFLYLIATIFARYLLTNQVLEPVERLVEGARRIGQGDLDFRLAVSGAREFQRMADTFNQMADQLGERTDALAEARERLRDAFSRYVAPELADEVMVSGAHLGGETLQAAVLFADIRGFTKLAHVMPPAEVVALLNDYFTAIEPAIRGEGGWINKFGGDSLLAVFSEPSLQEVYVEKAVRAAVHMRTALEAFNKRQTERGAPELRVGIGVHCGEVVAGSVGSPNRMEYTVIGEVVNLAARIQGLSGEWGVDILLSQEVSFYLDERFQVTPMPPARVRGHDHPVQLYALKSYPLC